MTTNLPPTVMSPERKTHSSDLSLIAAIEEQIKQEKLNLEANRILGNESERLASWHRIADAEIMLLTLSGYLPL